MNRIDKTFETLRQKKEKALVGFITAGDPNISDSFSIIKAMCKSGLDILELGVSFSDPTADGPAIQRSSSRALKDGINLRAVLEITGRLRQETGNALRRGTITLPRHSKSPIFGKSSVGSLGGKILPGTRACPGMGGSKQW